MSVAAKQRARIAVESKAAKGIIDVDSTALREELFPDIRSTGREDNSHYIVELDDKQAGPLLLELLRQTRGYFTKGIQLEIGCQVFAGLYMRRAGMEINPSVSQLLNDKNNCARVFYHGGDKVIYNVTDMSGKDPERVITAVDKEIHLLSPDNKRLHRLSSQAGNRLHLPGGGTIIKHNGYWFISVVMEFAIPIHLDKVDPNLVKLGTKIANDLVEKDTNRKRANNSDSATDAATDGATIIDDGDIAAL